MVEKLLYNYENWIYFKTTLSKVFSEISFANWLAKKDLICVDNSNRC